jgi:hypothetical protein
MSASEIDYKQLEMDASLYASEELESAAKVLAAMLETMGEPEREIIRKYPALVVGLARLTHADALAHEARVKTALAENRPAPTEREKSIIYRALEADLLFGDHRPTSIEEMDAALARYKKMAGL